MRPGRKAKCAAHEPPIFDQPKALQMVQLLFRRRGKGQRAGVILQLDQAVADMHVRPSFQRAWTKEIAER